MFGLTNFASRYVLPSAIAYVGLFYILAGALCLLMPTISFLHPIAMGMVFCAGEWAGGTILYLDDRRYAAFAKQFSTLDEEAT
jgi:membrane-anchored protein YejM (alkaline phosphatase superfamily)